MAHSPPSVLKTSLRELLLAYPIAFRRQWVVIGIKLVVHTDFVIITMILNIVGGLQIHPLSREQ